MRGEKVRKRKPHLPGRPKPTRAQARMGQQMQLTFERRLQIPLDAPARLVQDIETYSALVEFQAKMGGTAGWYQKLT